MLFGPDDPLEDSAEMKDEQHEDITKTVESTTLIPFKAIGTTERSFFDFLRAGLDIIDANEDPINTILSIQANKTENDDKLNNSEESVTTFAPKVTFTESVKVLEITSTTQGSTKQTSPTTARTTTITVKTTQKPKPTTRQTTTKRIEKQTTKNASTTSKPPTTTIKILPTTITVKTSTPSLTTTKKSIQVTTRKPTTLKQVVTTSKPATTATLKPKINTTSKNIPTTTTTSAPKITTTTVQPKTTLIPQRTNQSSIETITEEVKISLKPTTFESNTQSPIPMTTMKSQHLTTENILSAFFSGLSSIFDEQKKTGQVVGTKYALTPQPPINQLILSKPSLNSNPTIIDTDYVYDYNEPTLPPSLPNLKIIPFLPADAVNNVNYFKPNLESRITSTYPAITEKYDVYGSIIRSENLETDPTRLDYGGVYSNFNKDSQYNIYGSGLADPPLAVKSQSSDQLADTYDTPLKAQDTIKQTTNGNNHVRYNTKFIRDKYDTVDYDFNPNEKIDKFEGELKYIPHSYEPNYNEYGKYPGGNAGYPGASFEHDKYYTYSDKYDVTPDSTYVDKKPGLFSPPTKTEGKMTEAQNFVNT